MANFDADTLRALRDVREAAICTEQHPKSAVIIWVVVADDEVFVRSWRGSKGRWYRDLAAGGPAMLEFAGRRLAVRAIPASDPAWSRSGFPLRGEAWGGARAPPSFGCSPEVVNCSKASIGTVHVELARD